MEFKRHLLSAQVDDEKRDMGKLNKVCRIPRVILLIFSDRRKTEEVSKDANTSPKRSKRHSPSSPGHQSSSSSESETEKPVSAFYQSLLESSYADDGMKLLCVCVWDLRDLKLNNFRFRANY